LKQGNNFLFASIFIIAIIQLAVLFFSYSPDVVSKYILEANSPPPTTESTETVIAEESVNETEISEETVSQESTVINTALSETQVKILADAKKQAEEKVVNKSEYYEGGYPPESEGTAADVIARALKNSGIDLRELIYQDMLAAKDQYPWEKYQYKDIDKNIDFRRTPNQTVFFNRNALVLTNEFVKDDPENSAQWQPGDFVYFSTEGDDWAETCGIISDTLSDEGIPLVIHNTADPGYVVEDDFLLAYKIVGHFRYPES